MEAESDFLKYNVVPRRRELDESSIPLLVQEIIDSGLWIGFEDEDGKLIVKEKSFTDHQRLEYKKEMKSKWEGKQLNSPTTRRAFDDASVQRELKERELKEREGKEREYERKPKEPSNPETEDKRKKFTQAFTVKCNRLRSKYPRFNPQLFFQNNLDGNRDAILLCLDRLLESEQPISNPEAYCEKIISIESGKLNEREAIKIHEEIKKNSPSSLGECLRRATE
jgi:hypothetical protein